ncbi:MAG TPA: hypothetical protein VMV49_13310 [Candidatus Deferrimicrobium sp.]|nr:hypothetical protein [Candidatus Deferrimicrobium sp.]
MVEEIYETTLGLFKIETDAENNELVNVQTCVTTYENQIWENMGFMKKKDFYKFISNYNPKKY